MMDIKTMVQIAHNTAVQHQFWEPEPEKGTSIALMHSELSEVLEELRAGRAADEVYYECRAADTCESYVYGKCAASAGKRTACGHAKPCGVPSELADTVIRIADFCGRYGIDLQEAIIEKMAFNESRPPKHGKSF